MPSRFRSRQQALQMLYLWDVRRQPIEEVVRDYYGSLAIEEGEVAQAQDGFGEMLAVGAVFAAAEIDTRPLGSESAMFNWFVYNLSLESRARESVKDRGFSKR